MSCDLDLKVSMRDLYFVKKTQHSCLVSHVGQSKSDSVQEANEACWADTRKNSNPRSSVAYTIVYKRHWTSTNIACRISWTRMMQKYPVMCKVGRAASSLNESQHVYHLAPKLFHFIPIVGQVGKWKEEHLRMWSHVPFLFLHVGASRPRVEIKDWSTCKVVL